MDTILGVFWTVCSLFGTFDDFDENLRTLTVSQMPCLLSCWSLKRSLACLTVFVHDGLLVSGLTSHSLTCSAVLVHTTFGHLDHAMSVLFFFSVVFVFCLWQVSQAENWPQRPMEELSPLYPGPSLQLGIRLQSCACSSCAHWSLKYVSLYCARLLDH